LELKEQIKIVFEAFCMADHCTRLECGDCVDDQADEIIQIFERKLLTQKEKDNEN
jgi:hypothetical protein